MRDDDGNLLFPITEAMILAGQNKMTRDTFKDIVGLTLEEFCRELLDNSIGISEALAKTSYINLDHILHKTLRAFQSQAKDFWEYQRLVNNHTNLQLMSADDNQKEKKNELIVCRYWNGKEWIDVSVLLIFPHSLDIISLTLYLILLSS